jgi:hypothetical protein
MNLTELASVGYSNKIVLWISEETDLFISIALSLKIESSYPMIVQKLNYSFKITWKQHKFQGAILCWVGSLSQKHFTYNKSHVTFCQTFGCSIVGSKKKYLVFSLSLFRHSFTTFYKFRN